MHNNNIDLIVPKFNRMKDGVTLLELLAVVIVLGIISTISIIAIGGLIEKTRENADYASLQVLNEATRNYRMLETIELDDIFQDIIKDGERLEKLVEEGYLESLVSTQVKDTNFVWDVDKQQWEYVDADDKIIIILDSKFISAATQQIFLSFEIYIETWLDENATMPVFNQNNASLSWSSANYTGTSQTNIYAANFWNGYFEFADTDGFDASNSSISDFKIFFKRDINGVVTTEMVAVYLQMGGDRSIYFDNNVTITQTHYSVYLDTVTKQVVPPTT